MPSSAHAGAYPWVTLGDDVRIVADPRVENALRLALVERARRTVDFVTYDLRPDDEVAMPLASALRDAADRGVRVRVVTSWTTHVLFDRNDRFGRQLIDPPTRAPIELVVAGGPALEDHGWGALDSVHEKLLIVDGQVVLATGRGIGAEYLAWLDTAFLLRGALVGEAAQSFDALWDELAQHHRPFAGNIRWHEHPRPRAPRFSPPPVDEAVAARARALLAWATAPAAPMSVGRGRALHHDLLHQLHQLTPTPIDLDVDQRAAAVDDPVLDALVERLARARTARISMLSAILHPRLRDALAAARRRGAEVTVMVNVRAPGFGPERRAITPSGSVWSAELPDLDALLAAGVRVYRFQVNGDAPWVYLHRKLAILDDAVLFGSHNFNLPSSVTDDELSFEVESAPLADDARRLFDGDLARHGLPIDPTLVKVEKRRAGRRMMRWLSLGFLGYM